MKRKIVKHGSATLTISLPSKWVKLYGIKPGDALDIEENEGSLLVKCPEFRESVKETFIDLSQHDVSKRALRALFKGGCDTIRIKYKDANTFSSTIMPTLNEFIGFEIMSQDTNSCLVKEISGLTENTELDGLVRRLFHILQSLADDCTKALKELNPGVLTDIVERDVAVNRAANFIRRLLNKRGTTKIRELPVVYYIVEELEGLGDEYKYLCRYLLKQKYKGPIDPELLALFEKTSQLLGEFTSLYFKFSYAGAQRITDGHDAISEKMHALSLKSTQDAIILAHMSRMTRVVTDMLGPLLTLRLPDVCAQDQVLLASSKERQA